MGTGVITENGIEKKSFSDFLLSQPVQKNAGLPKVVADMRALKEKILASEITTLNP